MHAPRAISDAIYRCQLVSRRMWAAISLCLWWFRRDHWFEFSENHFAKWARFRCFDLFCKKWRRWRTSCKLRRVNTEHLPQQSSHFWWNIIVRNGHVVGKNCGVHFRFPVRYRLLRCLCSGRCITCALKIFHQNSNHFCERYAFSKSIAYIVAAEQIKCGRSGHRVFGERNALNNGDPFTLEMSPLKRSVVIHQHNVQEHGAICACFGRYIDVQLSANQIQ